MVNEEESRKVIAILRDEGYAVTIFTPEELKGVDASMLEEIMEERGWNYIDFNSKEPF